VTTARLASAFLLAALLVAGCAIVTSPSGSTDAGPSAAIASEAAPSPSVASDAPSAVASTDDVAVGSCQELATPTTAQTEGPYFTAGSPEKANFVEDGMPGTKLTLTGLVVDTGCRPLANAKVDLWQADASGVYDNSGYRLRGHVFTKADGRFTIHTVVPGEYPGRTPHIHMKVTPQGGGTLTTQLYLPTSGSTNEADGIFRQGLLVDLTDGADGLTAAYTFVLAA